MATSLFEADYGSVSISSLTPSRCPAALREMFDSDADLSEGSPCAWLLMMPRLQELFVRFEKAICCKSDIMKKDYANKVRSALRKTNGVKLPDIMTQQAFQTLLNEEIEKMRGPTVEMLEDVYAYMTELGSVLVTESFAIYPHLRDHCQHVIDSMFESSLKLCHERLDELLLMEQDIFTLNHYYAGIFVALLVLHCIFIFTFRTHSYNLSRLLY